MKLRNIALTLTVLTVVLFQMISPTVVFADGEVPPETTPVEETTPPEDGTTPPVDETVPPAETPVEQTTPLLEQLPPETTVVVVNETGAVEPLATEEAAAAIEDGDPVWCEDGYTPDDDPDGTAGFCTSSYARFTGTKGLLAELSSKPDQYNTAGTIYVKRGDIALGDRNTSIIIDGAALGALAGHDLTIQGGWRFVVDGDDYVDGYTDFSGTDSEGLDWASNLAITNWGGSILVNNIRVNGYSGNGLEIETDGAATVTDSRFNNNLLSGVDINAGGDVTLTDVNAKENFERGARLRAGGAVTVNGGQFDENGMSGLRIVSTGGKALEAEEAADGGVTLNNVYARWNGIQGANLDGVMGDVAVNGGVFRGNDKNGLRIFVTDDGNVLLTGVLAINNGKDGTGSGANIDTGGNITVESSAFEGNDNGLLAEAGYGGAKEGSSAHNITLTDVWLLSNRKDGADLYTYDGSITLNQVYASGNRVGVMAFASQTVDVSDSVFGALESEGLVGNDDIGLYAQGMNVNLDNVTANGNGFLGADVYGILSTSVNGSDFSANGFRDPYESEGVPGMLPMWAGLRLFSVGDILLSDVTANDNFSEYSYYGFPSPSGIFALLGAMPGGAFGASEPYSANLSVDSVTASGNTGAGLLVMEPPYFWGNGVSVTGPEETGNSHNIWVSDSTFNNNLGGIVVLMEGPFCGMNIQNTTATRNDVGLAVSGYYGDILITDSVFNENSYAGIDLYDVNNVTLYNVEANGNLDEYAGGAYIDSSGSVVIECSRFNANTGDGLYVANAGQLKLLSVTAEGNGKQNLSIDPGILVEIGTSLCGRGGQNKPAQPAYSQLTCTEPETVATLTSEKGDMVVFNQLCNYEARLLVETQSDLPGTLPEGNTFVSGLHVKVLEDGKSLSVLPTGKSMLVSFKLPEGAAADYAILWWDGSQWVDLGGEKSADGLYFQVTTDKTGTFILVQK